MVVENALKSIFYPSFITKTKVIGDGVLKCEDLWILIQVWIDLVYLVFRTFTEDKVPTEASSLCCFIV